MSSSPEVASLARLVTTLQSRLDNLERATQLTHSSVQGDDGEAYSAREGIISGVQAASMAADALSQLVDLQATTDGKVTVFYADDAPTEEAENPEYGDQWLVTGDSTVYLGTTYLKGSLFRYDGEVWSLEQDARAAADALAAAQNAQDTADGKIETYWQATDPRPGITPASGDLWYQLDAQLQVLAVWRWDEPGTAWRSLPLTTGAIAQGGVAPDRLTVGVVANLVQDPVFKTSIRTPPADWQILGPDSDYPANNFLRCQDRTPGTLGDPSSDSTMMLTDRVPVDPGRTLRAAALVRCDAAAVAGGPAPTISRLRVWFFSTDATLAPLSGTDQIVGEVLADSMSGVYEQWVLQEGTFVVPEGYSSAQVAAQVTNQVAGHVDFIRPEVQVLWGQVQSGDYQEGTSGWILSSDATQFTNVNVVGNLGAANVSAGTLELGGVDVADQIALRPAGITAYGRSFTAAGFANTDETTGTVRLLTHELHGGAMMMGRAYKVKAHGFIDVTVQGATYEVAIVYTTDGTKPLNTSQVLDGAVRNITTTATSVASFDVESIFLPAANYPTTRFGLGIRLLTGSGTAHVRLADSNRIVEMWVEDWGATDAVPTSGNNGELVIRSGPAASTTEAVQTYTQSWLATWSRSYDSDKGVREGDDTTTMYQGYGVSSHGNTRSLCGFDYAAIQAALSGATVKSVTLTYRVRHAYDTDGITVLVSSHAYTARPATWASGSVNEDRAHFPNQREGSTYTQTLPLAIGNEFKAGTTRGLGFGPGPNNSSFAYYGYMYGAPGTAGPKLTIVYTK